MNPARIIMVCLLRLQIFALEGKKEKKRKEKEKSSEEKNVNGKRHSFTHNTQVGLHINAAHPLGSSHMEKRRTL